MIPSSLNQIYNNNNIAHQWGPRSFFFFFNKYAQIFGSTARLWVFGRRALICTDVRAGKAFVLGKMKKGRKKDNFTVGNNALVIFSYFPHVILSVAELRFMAMRQTDRHSFL